jgi:hypothetical protein
VFIIGIDPHKGSHTAAAIDVDEQVVGELSVLADRRQRDRLLAWGAPQAQAARRTGRAARKRCAASNDGSATPSTDNSAPTPATKTNWVREDNQGRL